VGWGEGDFIGKKKYRHNDAWGSRKNKFPILGVEEAGWQAAKTPEYLDIPNFRTGGQTGCIGVQNVTLFLNEPFVRGASDRVW
jgi:hypothetical protein